MHTLVKTSIVAALAAFAVTGVARAEGVKIDFAGKDAKAVHTEILHAALKVCQTSGAAVDIGMGYETRCVADTVHKAEADYRQMSGAH